MAKAGTGGAKAKPAVGAHGWIVRATAGVGGSTGGSGTVPDEPCLYYLCCWWGFQLPGRWRVRPRGEEVIALKA